MIVGSDLLSLHLVLSLCRWRNVGHGGVVITEIRMRAIRMITRATCHREMCATSALSGPVGDASEKFVDKPSVKEFRERFCIPNGVLVEFMDEEDVVSTEKAEGRAITFSKEQFNAGLRFSLPALFKKFLHFTQIPPAFIHPNIVRC
ncbi:hypothetical protein AAG906_007719 [Vitis piasezkii]